MWLQRAAEQGDGKAQWHLGARYESGRGVRQDYAEAARWYRKAAEQGFELAYVNLGQMYYEGRGVTQDYAEALKWFSRAADLGDVGGQYFLGWMYFNGQGVSSDYVQAYMWLNLAAARVIVLEEKERDDYVHKRDMVASKMTSAQIAESQRLAREWKPKWER
jgi:TPR repeat protein